MQLSLKGGITCREAAADSESNFRAAVHRSSRCPYIASTRGTTEDCVRGVRKHECELERCHLNSQQLTKTGGGRGFNLDDRRCLAVEIIQGQVGETDGNSDIANVQTHF